MATKLFKHYQDNSDHSDLFGQHWSTVQQLHISSKAQVKTLVPFMLHYAWRRATFRKVQFNWDKFSDKYLSIDPCQGKFLYSVVLSKQPQNIFEFGGSFGISALYMTQALATLKAGQLISSELIDAKAKAANQVLKQCELAHRGRVVCGDVFTTIEEHPGNLDMVFMDGPPALNLKVLKALEPKLNAGCIILTDDVHLFKKEMKDYLKYLNHHPNYASAPLELSDGMHLAIKLNKEKPISSTDASEDCANATMESYAKKT